MTTRPNTATPDGERNAAAVGSEADSGSLPSERLTNSRFEKWDVPVNDQAPGQVRWRAVGLLTPRCSEPMGTAAWIPLPTDRFTGDGRQRSWAREKAARRVSTP